MNHLADYDDSDDNDGQEPSTVTDNPPEKKPFSMFFGNDDGPDSDEEREAEQKRIRAEKKQQEQEEYEQDQERKRKLPPPTFSINQKPEFLQRSTDGKIDFYELSAAAKAQQIQQQQQLLQAQQQQQQQQAAAAPVAIVTSVKMPVSEQVAKAKRDFDQMKRLNEKGDQLTFQQREKRKRDLGQASRGKNYVEEEKRMLRTGEFENELSEVKRPGDKRVAQREKSKRELGQSAHATWKSEEEMIMRQHYD